MKYENDLQKIVSGMLNDPDKMESVCEDFAEQQTKATHLDYGAFYLHACFDEGIRIALIFASQGKVFSPSSIFPPPREDYGYTKEVGDFIESKLIEEGIIIRSGEFRFVELTEKGVNVVLGMAKNKGYLEDQKITEAGKQYLRDRHIGLPEDYTPKNKKCI